LADPELIDELLRAKSFLTVPDQDRPEVVTATLLDQVRDSPQREVQPVLWTHKADPAAHRSGFGGAPR